MDQTQTPPEADTLPAHIRARLQEIAAAIDTDDNGPLTAGRASYSRSSLNRQLQAERHFSAQNPMENFGRALSRHFDADTIAQIARTFERLQLPLPASDIEFLNGYEGAILFSNTYGMVLRIERLDDDILIDDSVARVDDNPWVLKPIASLRAGRAIIEICPGVHTTDRRLDSSILEFELKRTGAKFYDASPTNAGLLPIRTPQYPNGVPVVIDRLAVAKLSARARKVAEALRRMGIRQSPQNLLYADLRESFAKAWPKGRRLPDPQKMAAFWQLMREHREAGILVAGWNEKSKDTYKATSARIAAASYDQTLRRAFKAAQERDKPPRKRRHNPTNSAPTSRR